MKRLFFIICVLGVLVAPNVFAAERGIFFVPVGLALTTDDGASGTSTAPSGTSYFYVNTYDDYKEDSQTLVIKDLGGIFSLQLRSVTGVTPASGNASVGPTAGWKSGTTFSIFYQVSNVNSTDAWSGVSKQFISSFNGIANSGNTLYVQQVDDADYARFMRWGWVSETTGVGKANFDMIMR